MYTFSATVNSNNVINIESNTYWSCKAEGNFMLSKYDGTGNDNIDIIVPKDVMSVNGYVTFSYGDERCKYPVIAIYSANNCFIETTPSYNECEGEKTIYFFYEDEGETFYVSVVCFDGWTADSSNLKFITSDNDVMIISSYEDGELRIIPTRNCDNKSVVHVKLIKKK